MTASVCQFVGPACSLNLHALTGHALRAQRNARAKAQMIVSEEVLDNEARVNAQLTVAYVRLQRL